MKIKKYWERTEYPCIVKCKEKYHDYLYIVNNKTELLACFYEIIMRRYRDVDYGLSEQEKTQFWKIFDASNKYEVDFRIYWDFLFGRAGYEYEHIEIVYPDKFDD